MTKTVSALYDTYSQASAAVNALEAAGVPHSDISIVANNSDNWHRDDRASDAGTGAGAGAGAGAAVGGVGGLLTGLGIMAIPGVGPVTALAFKSAVDDPNRFKRSRKCGRPFWPDAATLAVRHIDRLSGADFQSW